MARGQAMFAAVAQLGGLGARVPARPALLCRQLTRHKIIVAIYVQPTLADHAGLSPGAENRRADADVGRPEFDCRREIGAHAHGEEF